MPKGAQNPADRDLGKVQSTAKDGKLQQSIPIYSTAEKVETLVYDSGQAKTFPSKL